MRTIALVSPGEMLDEEFLKPLGLTKYRLAKDIGVPPQHAESSKTPNGPKNRCYSTHEEKIISAGL